MSLQLITILWMCGEAAIALFAARRAHSVALLGFGADSGIELVSAFVVLLSFRLSGRKKELAAKTNCDSLKADAAQTAMCAYLAWIALGGLIVNVVFKVSWADPMAALLLLPTILREGSEAMQGKTCSDCV